jgi:hypothetical protein
MPDALCEIGAHHGGCLVNHGLAGVKFWYLARMVFQSKAILVYEKDLRGDGCWRRAFVSKLDAPGYVTRLFRPG